MSTAPVEAPWPLDQIQGFLLRGYRADFARHFALKVAEGDAALAAARAFVLSLTDPYNAMSITTAVPWGPLKPAFSLNLGFTYAGLVRFGLAADSLAMFDPISGDPNVSAFGAGMARRAVATPGLNLVNASAPPNWVMSDTDFDLMLSIWTDDDDWRDKITKTIGDMIPGTFCTLTDDRIFDGHSFKTNQVYFGFEDNISQPIIAGSPFDRPSDGGQDEVDPSAFLIGTGADIYGAQPFSPARLGLYGCFAGFLVIRQEVEAFAQQVTGLAGSMSQFGVTDPSVQQEALMASMCGRWRDGTSLAVFPINGNDMPPADPDRTMLNDFRYAPDDAGAICPIGSHMRRANMRLRSGDPTLGFPGAPSMPHRIMRRAMPYQIPYEPENRDDPATERGLVGMFLGTSLLQQFEQVFGQWINAQFFTDLELADTVMGAPDPGCVTGPGADQPTIGADVTSCVAIKAAAYVFYPGIDGIRFVAGA